MSRSGRECLNICICVVVVILHSCRTIIEQVTVANETKIVPFVTMVMKDAESANQLGDGFTKLLPQEAFLMFQKTVCGW